MSNVSYSMLSSLTILTGASSSSSSSFTFSFGTIVFDFLNGDLPSFGEVTFEDTFEDAFETFYLIAC
jgi:hypothetical protein